MTGCNYPQMGHSVRHTASWALHLSLNYCLSFALSGPVFLALFCGPVFIHLCLCLFQVGLFNFRPSVRPVPLEVHIQGFPGQHYCPRMASMNKPVFQGTRSSNMYTHWRKWSGGNANSIIMYSHFKCSKLYICVTQMLSFVLQYIWIFTSMKKIEEIVMLSMVESGGSPALKEYKTFWRMWVTVVGHYWLP